MNRSLVETGVIDRSVVQLREYRQHERWYGSDEELLLASSVLNQLRITQGVSYVGDMTEPFCKLLNPKTFIAVLTGNDLQFLPKLLFAPGAQQHSRTSTGHVPELYMVISISISFNWLMDLKSHLGVKAIPPRRDLRGRNHPSPYNVCTGLASICK